MSVLPLDSQDLYGGSEDAKKSHGKNRIIAGVIVGLLLIGTGVAFGVGLATRETTTTTTEAVIVHSTPVTTVATATTITTTATTMTTTTATEADANSTNIATEANTTLAN